MLVDSRLEKRETELDLFRRAKTGDFAAFQEIVEQLQPRVFGLMLRILHQTT